MARKCPVAKKGTNRCYIHDLPTRSVSALFERLIVDEYSRQELKDYHNMVISAMLDKDKRIR